MQGEPLNASVWVVTQLHHPEGLYIPLPPQSRFRDGYTLLSKKAPPTLAVKGRLLSVQRDLEQAYKIGADADTLLWVGKTTALRIDSPRLAGANYPDLGSSAEIYTNPNPLPYIELETLGPLHGMKKGDRIERVNIYTLFRRAETDPEREARKILGE